MVEFESEPRSNWSEVHTLLTGPLILGCGCRSPGRVWFSRKCLSARSMHKSMISSWANLANWFVNFCAFPECSEGLLRHSFCSENTAQSDTSYYLSFFFFFSFPHLILVAGINVQKNVLHQLGCKFTKATVALSTCPYSFFSLRGLSILCQKNITSFNFIISIG